MHPFRRYAVPVGIALVVLGVIWLMVAPLIAYLSVFWPVLAIAAAIGLFFWLRTFQRFGELAEAFGQAAQNQPLRGILVGLLLTAVLGYLFWLFFWFVPDILVTNLGIQRRFAWLLMVILGLPAIQFAWMIYQYTGIPGDPAVIGRAFRGLQVLVLLFFAWWYAAEPSILEEAGIAGRFEGTPQFFQQFVQFPWGWRTGLLGLVLLALTSAGGLLGRVFLGLGAFALAGSILFPLFRETEVKAEALAIAEAPRVQEFTCNAREFKETVRSGSGYYFRITANKPWKAFSLKTYDTGQAGEFVMPAGESSWRGGDPPGILRVQCLEDGTTLRFESKE